MNNEPVAWMLLGLEDRKPKLINLQVIEHLEGTWIPLYTHPASLVDWSYQQGYQVGKETHPSKDLTDEEDTECQYCKQGCIRCDARKTLTDEEIIKLFDSYEFSDEGVVEFAHELLRKAQKK